MDSKTKYINSCLNAEEREAFAKLRNLKAYKVGTIDSYDIDDIARGEPAFTDVWYTVAHATDMYECYPGDYESYLDWFHDDEKALTPRTYGSLIKWLNKYENLARESDARVEARLRAETQNRE